MLFFNVSLTSISVKTPKPSTFRASITRVRVVSKSKFDRTTKDIVLLLSLLIFDLYLYSLVTIRVPDDPETRQPRLSIIWMPNHYSRRLSLAGDRLASATLHRLDLSATHLAE